MSQSIGCGSKLGNPNGTLVNGNMDENLRSPGGAILTHTQLRNLQGGYLRGCPFCGWFQGNPPQEANGFFGVLP